MLVVVLLLSFIVFGVWNEYHAGLSLVLDGLVISCCLGAVWCRVVLPCLVLSSHFFRLASVCLLSLFVVFRLVLYLVFISSPRLAVVSLFSCFRNRSLSLI